MSGIPHLDVYVREIPIRLSAMELVRFATNRNNAGKKKDLNNSNVSTNLGANLQKSTCRNRPNNKDPPKRNNVKRVGRGIDSK